MGTFGRTVRDATYAFDAIWGHDPRDNYTSVTANTPNVDNKTFVEYLSNKESLKGATFGLPWQTFWTLADPEQLAALTTMLDLISSAGATTINGTEIPKAEKLVSPTGWDWDYGSTRGFPNESEYTYVKVDFYNNIATYLSTLSNTPIHSLQDLVDYNFGNDGSEGGNPWPLGSPAFYSGQDGFLTSLNTSGVRDATYWQALEWCQSNTRNGIDAALNYNGHTLDALLVPPDVGQTYQIAAQAGYPVVTIPAGVHAESGMPFGLALMQSAWEEGKLIRWASAIEDLVQFEGAALGLGRTLPQWRGYLERNIPVVNEVYTQSSNE